MTHSATSGPVPKLTRVLVTLTTFVTLLPLLVFLGLCVNEPWLLPNVIAIGAFMLAAAVALRGCLRVLAVLVGVVALCLLPHFADWGLHELATPEHTYLVLGARSPVVGVDVYCNDVHLGKTPLRISRAEFDAKVPWLQSPPRQERLDIQHRQFRDAKYSQIPQDVLEQNPGGGRGWSKEVWMDSEKAPDFLKTSQHWWHFEADGHSGLGRLLSFEPGELKERGYFQGRCYEIKADADVDYPALGPHLDAMVEALRRPYYRPDDAWIAHFLKDDSLLFLEFHKRALDDLRLMPALEAAVRAEFRLPERPTATDCGRVLNDITSRTEARGVFITPSMESMALDLMGRAATDALVCRFRQEMSVRADSWSSGSGEDYRIQTSDGRAARMLPLEYLVGRLHPEALFAPLVYEYSRGGRFFSLVAGYKSDAAARILTQRLRAAGGPDDYRMFGLLEDLASIRSPQAEQDMRDFVRDKAEGREFASHVREFVMSRIGDPTIDQAELATWVYRWAPLEESVKIDLISRINSKLTYHYLQMLGVDKDRAKRENAINFLASNPNPRLDQFVIDTYRWYDSPQGPGYWSTSAGEALVRTDTPAIREFIRTTLASGGPEARKLMDRLAATTADMTTLPWATDLFQRLAEPAMRADAARVLARVDTPAARSLLEAWAADPDAAVASASSEALAAHRARQALADLRFRQYGELLSGKLRPDDLLPPAQPWVWNGETYVPEKPAAGGAP